MTADDLGTAEPVRDMVEEDLGDPLLITNPFRAKVRAAAASVKRSPAVAEIMQAQQAVLEDDLEFPPFLRRVPA
jgi:hypothetical protein